MRERRVDLEWEVLHDAPNAITPADGELVQTLAQKVAEVTGIAPSVTCCPGVLESHIYNQLGVPAVAFGPGLTERMHAPEEDVPIANLTAAAAIYVEIAVALARRS